MKNLFYLVVLIITNSVFAQNSDLNKQKKAYELCAAFSNFSNSVEANSALKKILSVVGVAQNFVMKDCNNVSNASAIQVEGIRYIFYNPEWMRSVDSNYSNAGMFVLAHEVGHHVNGHTVDAVLLMTKIVNSKSLNEKRQQELQADEFAGFVMAKLGTPLSQINEILYDTTSDADDTNSTHPSRTKRLQAVKKGYENGLNNGGNSNDNVNIVKNSSVIVYDDGSRWEGNIVINTSQVISKNGWVGSTKTKSPDGNGIMYFADGSVYKGTYYGGKRSGYGEMYYMDGSIYKGQWLNGQKSGRGELINPNGKKSILVNGESEANKFYKEGIEKFDLEDYQGALLRFNKAIELDSQDAVF